MIQQIVLTDLTPDPRLERITMLSDLVVHNIAKAKSKNVGDKKELHIKHATAFTKDFTALVESIRTQGLLMPLMVWDLNGEWLIADGRHRWMAAQEAGLAAVDCIIISAEKALDVILDSENRRHFTKGALAYRAVLLCPEVATEAKAGNPQLSTQSTIGNQTDLSARISVSRDLMHSACSLYQIFKEHPPLRKKHELTVWSCANILKLLEDMKIRAERFRDTGSYDAPKKASLTKEKKEELERIASGASVLRAARKRLEDAETTAGGWAHLTNDQKTIVKKNISEEINILPDEFLAIYSACLSEKLKGENNVG